MLKDRIYLIHSGSTIESLYTLFPFIISRFSHLLVYIHVDSREAQRVSGKCVVLIRVFKGNKTLATNVQKKRDFIQDFRKRFDRVIMLDDGAGSDSLHFEYMDLVDLYYKGKLLRDRENYLLPMYGRQLFTNYYHNKFGIVDENVKIREMPGNPDLLKKLRISWNLGCGIYPIPGKNLVRLAKAAMKFGFGKCLKPWFLFNYNRMINTLGESVDIATKLPKVQSRFGNNPLPGTIGFQRTLFLQKCLNSEFVLSGAVNPTLYKQELKRVSAVLSPFGWGEVCFRDFETILNGCLLIKPDMHHLETWPDIYQNSKTYLPVDWDGNNLMDIIRDVSKNIESYSNIIHTGRKEYRKSLLELDDRVLQFLTEASGEHTHTTNVEYNPFYTEKAVN